MAPATATHELKLAVPAPRVWKALKDSQLLAKAVKPVVVAVEDVQGGGANASVGDIRIVKFNPELVPFPFVKEKCTVLDESALKIGSTVLEGGFVGTQLSSHSAVITVKPEGADSCTLSWVLEYDAIVEKPDIDKIVEGFVATFKAIEAYLQATTDYS